MELQLEIFRRRTASIAGVAALILVAVGAATGASAADNTPDGTPQIADEVTITPSDVASEAEKLTLPAIPLEAQEYIDALQGELDGDARFSAVEVSENRKQVTVWWHGEVSAGLSALLRDSAAVVEVSVAQTAFLPGDLRDAAQHVLREGAALGVERVTVAVDGSHLEVAAAGIGSSRRDVQSSEELMSRLAQLTQIPLTVSQSGVEPAATRLNDNNYHLGGARITNFWVGSRCTSGFSVQKGEAQGTMFAAHCGSVGDFWVTTEGLTAWNYGTTESRQTAFDGAIMASNFSQPYVWFGPYDASGVGAISGSAVPAVGSEICYSGSFSGTVCGNVVTAKDVYTNLGGDLTSVRSIVTLNSAGLPAAGNGDSGGPGYIISASGGTTVRLATSIISAIPANSGSTCNGVPGDSGMNGRKCSSTVYSTEVWRIANASGWSIQVAP